MTEFEFAATGGRLHRCLHCGFKKKKVFSHKGLQRLDYGRVFLVQSRSLWKNARDFGQGLNKTATKDGDFIIYKVYFLSIIFLRARLSSTLSTLEYIPRTSCRSTTTRT